MREVGATVDGSGDVSILEVGAELAAEVGATVEHTNGGHLAIVHRSGWTVYTSATPSSQRSTLHTRRFGGR